MSYPQFDLYEVLEVPTTASDDDIKKSYRRLARIYHPDVNRSPEAEERFKRVAAAYAILSDPQERSRYDFSRRIDPDIHTQWFSEADFTVSWERLMEEEFGPDWKDSRSYRSFRTSRMNYWLSNVQDHLVDRNLGISDFVLDARWAISDKITDFGYWVEDSAEDIWWALTDSPRRVLASIVGILVIIAVIAVLAWKLL